MGRKPGVYASWPECESHVSGFSGAKFKGFTNRHAADQAFKKPYTDFLPEDKKPAPMKINRPKISRQISRKLPKFPTGST